MTGPNIDGPREVIGLDTLSPVQLVTVLNALIAPILDTESGDIDPRDLSDAQLAELADAMMSATPSDEMDAPAHDVWRVCMMEIERRTQHK